MAQTDSPSVVVRALWFVFIGSWLSGLWLSISWALNVTVIGTPLGLKMINKVPWIVSLKSRTVENELVSEDGEVTVQESIEQVSLLIRAVYFVFVGWWVSGIWMAVAWVVSLTIIGLPLAIWMYGKLPALVSLYRY
jgi:uncharacterized membrane protein YccF (DUF307 family)